MSARFVLGVCLLSILLAHSAYSNPRSPGLATDASQVFDADTGEAITVYKATQVAHGSNTTVGSVLARAAAAILPGAAPVANAITAGNTVVNVFNNFQPTEGRSLAGVAGGGGITTGGADIGGTTGSTGGGTGGAVGGSTDVGGNAGVPIGSPASSPGNLASTASPASVDIAASTFLESVQSAMSGFQSTLSSLASAVPGPIGAGVKAVDYVARNAFLENSKASMSEPTATSAPLGSGFAAAMSNQRSVSPASNTTEPAPERYQPVIVPASAAIETAKAFPLPGDKKPDPKVPEPPKSTKVADSGTPNSEKSRDGGGGGGSAQGGNNPPKPPSPGSGSNTTPGNAADACTERMGCEELSKKLSNLLSYCRFLVGSLGSYECGIRNENSVRYCSELINSDKNSCSSDIKTELVKSETDPNKIAYFKIDFKTTKYKDFIVGALGEQSVADSLYHKKNTEVQADPPQEEFGSGPRK